MSFKRILEDLENHEEQPPEDELVGQLAGGDAKSWQADPDIVETAGVYGFLGGNNPFYTLSSPAGRAIGFPFPIERPGQLDAVDRIVDAFAQNQDVLFEAGTGSGKSPISIGVVSQFSSAYLLIGRNDLVDQWEGDFQNFKDIGFFKARQRFDCKLIKDNADLSRKPTCSTAKNSCSHTRTSLRRNAAIAVLKLGAGQEEANEAADKSCPECPYMVNRDVALSKPYVVMTLSLGLTMFKYLNWHPGVTKRDVLIIDECSELENEIMRFFEFSTSSKRVLRAISSSQHISTFFNPDIPEEAAFYDRWPRVRSNMRFLETLSNMRPDQGMQSCVMWTIDIGGMAKRARGFINADTANEYQKEIIDNCDGLIRMTQNMLTCLRDQVPHFAEVKDVDPKDHEEIETMDSKVAEVMERNDEDKLPFKMVHYSVRVSPLEAQGMFQRLCEPFAKHILMISATTGSAQLFSTAHSYTRPVVKIEMPSVFAVANRPVYAKQTGNMSKKTQFNDAPKVMAEILRITQFSSADHPRFDHVNQKGVIHTYNTAITNMVIKTLNDAGLGHRVVKLLGGGRVRAEALRRFKSAKEPLILVSPSAMLGLSLNDDMGRWQIIAKIPYAYLGDPSISHRKDKFNGWYAWQTAKDLIQTFGRVVRSDADWGTTYILDSAFSRFYAAEWPLFPKYIQEAIRAI